MKKTLIASVAGSVLAELECDLQILKTVKALEEKVRDLHTTDLLRMSVVHDSVAHLKHTLADLVEFPAVNYISGSYMSHGVGHVAEVASHYADYHRELNELWLSQVTDCKDSAEANLAELDEMQIEKKYKFDYKTHREAYFNVIDMFKAHGLRYSRTAEKLDIEGRVSMRALFRLGMHLERKEEELKPVQVIDALKTLLTIPTDAESHGTMWRHAPHAWILGHLVDLCEVFDVKTHVETLDPSPRGKMSTICADIGRQHIKKARKGATYFLNRNLDVTAFIQRAQNRFPEQQEERLNLAESAVGALEYFVEDLVEFPVDQKPARVYLDTVRSGVEVTPDVQDRLGAAFSYLTEGKAAQRLELLWVFRQMLTRVRNYVRAEQLANATERGDDLLDRLTDIAEYMTSNLGGDDKAKEENQILRAPAFSLAPVFHPLENEPVNVPEPVALYALSEVMGNEAEMRRQFGMNAHGFALSKRGYKTFLRLKELHSKGQLDEEETAALRF